MFFDVDRQGPILVFGRALYFELEDSNGVLQMFQV